MHYRREVDGLRAIAVLPVIFFHAGIEAFRGGFVGVDVFFVISGYLITSILISDLQRDCFSLWEFYERRARRILPALVVVVFACMLAAWFWLLPSDMKSFGGSVAAVALFASNFLFWRESGYFDTAAELKPLLHTWSLAVEEQYYILFPPLLWLAWKYRRQRIPVLLAAGFACSLAIAEWSVHTKPAAAFYLLPTRGWELLLGAAVAYYLSRTARPVPEGSAAEVGGWLGLSAICFATLMFSKNTQFPGVHALVPTVGTALVILFASEKTTVGKMLANPVLVGIGLISYSAYLWHQPLFAFARHRYIDEPSTLGWMTLSLLALSFGFLSWRFVETPFRERRRFSRKFIFAASLVSGLTLLASGILTYRTDGFLERDRWKEVRAIENIKAQRGSGFRYCNDHQVTSPFPHGSTCIVGDRSATPSGLLWGDSYAGAALHGIHKRLEGMKRSYYAVLSDGCPPVPGISRFNNAFDCFHDRQQQVIDAFNADPSLTDLVWVGRLRGLTGAHAQQGMFLDKGPPSPAAVEQKINAVLSGLIENHKRVVFVLEGPSFERSVPDQIAKSIARGTYFRDFQLQFRREDQVRERGLEASRLLRSRSIAYVDAMDLFCEASTCGAISADGIPLIVDGGHISHATSEKIAATVFHSLSEMKLE